MPEGYRPFYSLEEVTGATIGAPGDLGASNDDVAMQIEITGTATVLIQGSQNNEDWQNVSDPASGYTASTIVMLDRRVAFYRAYATSVTSGTVTAVMGYGRGRHRNMLNIGATQTPQGFNIGSINVSGFVPESRIIHATAPIRIDGGASADLSGDRTISLTTSGVTNRGIVVWDTATNGFKVQPAAAVDDSGNIQGNSLMVPESVDAGRILRGSSLVLLKQGVGLVNGDNHNVTRGAIQRSYIQISGPTAAFAVTGFSRPIGTGSTELLIVQNETTETMTIKRLDAGSLAANQIETNTGGDVVRVGPSLDMFIYDTNTGVWSYMDAEAITLANNSVTDAILRDSGALSVIGRSANSAGDPADISAAAASGAVLRESGSVLGFGTVATAGITDAAVTYAKIQDVSAISKLLGRGSAAGAGDVEEITLGTNLAMAGTTLNASGGAVVDLQTFTGDGTWTKPASVTSVYVIVAAGGGGGGGGRGMAAANTRGAGSGGGGGARTVGFFSAADLAATVAVTVGAGGTGGAGGTNGSGTAGGAGGTSSFGTHLVCYGGGGGAGGSTVAQCGGSGGGVHGVGVVGGGSNTSGGLPSTIAAASGVGNGGAGANTGTAGLPAEWGGASAGRVANTANSEPGGVSVWGGAGGGTGGSIDSSNNNRAASAGGGVGVYNTTGGGGGAAGTIGTGGAGTAGAAGDTTKSGTGGGGGGCNSAGTGGAGGTGGAPSGGGGGGGAGTDAVTAIGGAGGVGGAGKVWVWSW